MKLLIPPFYGVPLGVRRRTAAPAFSPDALFAGSEKGGWWDGSDTSTLFQSSGGSTAVTATSDPVGYWGDKSGNGNHLTQPDNTARRPTYQTTGIRFDGSDDCIYCVLPSDITGDTVDIYAVYRPIAETANGHVVSLAQDNSGTVTDGSGILMYRSSGSDHRVQRGFNDTTMNFAISSTYLAEARSDGANFTFTKTTSGGSTSDSEAFTTDFAADHIHVGGLAIGFGGGVNNCDIAEIVVIDRNLTTTERDDLRAYLISKWSIP